MTKHLDLMVLHDKPLCCHKNKQTTLKFLFCFMNVGMPTCLSLYNIHA